MPSSFDDETTCVRKVRYVRTRGIGGLIIWELGGGYLPDAYPNRDRLLQAVKHAAFGTTGVTERGTLPQAVRLFQNYPNPFNGQTVIQFELPHSGIVSLDVYNILGQHAATLRNSFMEASVHTAHWSPNLASGVYYYRLVLNGPATRGARCSICAERVGFGVRKARLFYRVTGFFSFCIRMSF